MMTKEQLKEAGELLYGERWKFALGEAIGRNETWVHRLFMDPQRAVIQPDDQTKIISLLDERINAATSLVNALTWDAAGMVVKKHEPVSVADCLTMSLNGDVAVKV